MSLAPGALLVLLLFASHASAEALLNVNIMRCDLQGDLQRNCAAPSGLQLLPQQEIESEFYVSYTLSCDRKYRGPQPSKIELKLDSGPGLTLNYKDFQNQAFVGTGLGPLVLIDSFPKELANRSFNDCQLSFSEIRAVPSAKVRGVWQAELQGHRALLESKLVLVASLEKVAILLPAYRFFQSLSERLESDLKQNEEAVRLARELSSCKQGEDCDLLFKLSSDTSLSLSLEERLLIMQLRGLLAEVSEVETIAPLILEDRFSEASIKILAKLGTDASTYENAEDQIKQLQTEIEELRGRIATLETQIN